MWKNECEALQFWFGIRSRSSNVDNSNETLCLNEDTRKRLWNGVMDLILCGRSTDTAACRRWDKIYAIGIFASLSFSSVQITSTHTPNLQNCQSASHPVNTHKTHTQQTEGNKKLCLQLAPEIKLLLKYALWKICEAEWELKLGNLSLWLNIKYKLRKSRIHNYKSISIYLLCCSDDGRAGRHFSTSVYSMGIAFVRSAYERTCDLYCVCAYARHRQCAYYPILLSDCWFIHAMHTHKHNNNNTYI